MSIYKRKDSGCWYIQFSDPQGRRVQVSSGTTNRKEAERLEAKLKHEAWKAERLEIKPDRTWNDAVMQWSADKGHKRSFERDIVDFRWLHNHLDGVPLAKINRQMVQDIARARLAEGVQASTINRMLDLIRAVLRRAERVWEWIDRAPAIVRMPETRMRIRYLSHAQAELLLLELPSHLAEMARLSLATGLREQNVVRLKWADVDLARSCAWVWADEAKGKRSIAVPLNADAMAVIRRQQGKHEEFVFTYKGRPVTRANNHAWRKALQRAGIKDFRWHDLRHTWASWHVQSGTPLNILQELGGWQSVEMVRRYAHLSPGHLADYAGNVEMPSRLRLIASK